MAFFHDHLLQQGGTAGVLMRLAGHDPWIVGAAILFAGLPNTYPDWGGWWEAVKDPTHPKVTHETALWGLVKYPYRWDIHDKLHKEHTGHIEYRLHQWVDGPFHEVPGPWWPRMWKAVVLCQLINILIIIFCFF